MVSSRTAITFDSYILPTFDHLGTAKKTAQLDTIALHLEPGITVWLIRAWYSDVNRCEVSRDARAELRFSFVIIVRKLLQNNSLCNLGWSTFLTFYGNLPVHVYDSCCKPQLAERRHERPSFSGNTKKLARELCGYYTPICDIARVRTKKILRIV